MKAAEVVGRIGRGARLGALLGLLTGALDIAFLMSAVLYGGRVEDRYVVDLARALILYTLIGAFYGAALSMPLSLLVLPRRAPTLVAVWLYLVAVAARTVHGPTFLGAAGAEAPGIGFHLTVAALALSAAHLVGRRAAAGAFGTMLWRSSVVISVVAVAVVVGVVRKSLDLSALVAREVAAILPAASDAGPERPNILLVTIDTLRADRLGAYGSTAGLTPALDKLAADGIVFENAIAQSSWTRPSFGSIFTSRYPSDHQATWRRLRDPSGKRISIYNRPLRAGLPTLAGLLDAAGYLTVAINTNVQTSTTFGFDRGFDHFVDLSRSLSVLTASIACRWPPLVLAGRCAAASSVSSEYPYLSADEIEPIFSAVVDRTERSREPTFLWVHLMDPHVPYRSHDGSGTSVGYADIERALAGPDGRERAKALVESAYSGAIRFTDASFARMLERIDRGGSNTVVVLTSDHGEEILERWRSENERGPGLELYYRGYGHGHTMYDELLRVPLIVRLSGKKSAGTRAKVPAMHVDIAPTLLAIAGLEARPAGFEPAGRDLLAIAGAQGDPAQRVVRSEGTLYGAEVKQIREGRRKIIKRYADGNEERYDLENDPRELKELGRAGGPSFAPLARVLDQWLASVPAEPEAPGRAEDVAAGDADLTKQLEALGYVE